MSSRSTSRRPEPRGERVQKVLASVGIASRREIDRLIQSGRVVIDGRTAIPGDRLTGREKVFVDGNRIRLPTSRFKGQVEPDILLYHKPAGEIAARRDPSQRKTVFDSLPRSPKGRWIEIGGLDVSASGLLLFTTDGELANRLVHPRYGLEQRYAVRVRGELSGTQLQALAAGVTFDDGQARLASVTALGSGRTNCWYEITLREIGNRNVRRMFDALGVPINRLIRIRYGPVALGRLPRGAHRLLEGREREGLISSVSDERPDTL